MVTISTTGVITIEGITDRIMIMVIVIADTNQTYEKNSGALA